MELHMQSVPDLFYILLCCLQLLVIHYQRLNERCIGQSGQNASHNDKQDDVKCTAAVIYLNPQPFWIVSAGASVDTGTILSFLALDSVAGGWSLACLLHFVLGLWSILKACSVVDSLAFTYTGTVLGCLVFFLAEPLTFVFGFLNLDDSQHKYVLFFRLIIAPGTIL